MQHLISASDLPFRWVHKETIDLTFQKPSLHNKYSFKSTGHRQKERFWLLRRPKHPNTHLQFFSSAFSLICWGGCLLSLMFALQQSALESTKQSQSKWCQGTKWLWLSKLRICSPNRLKKPAFRSSENTKHKKGLKWADTGGRKKKTTVEQWEMCQQWVWSISKGCSGSAPCRPALPVPWCPRDLMSLGGCRHLEFRVGWSLSSFYWEVTWREPRQL